MLGALAVAQHSLPFLGSLAPGPRAAAWALAGMSFLGVCIFVVGRAIWEEEDVSIDTLLGGVAVYLMVGAAFAMAFSGIERVFPGSYELGGAAPPGTAPEVAQFSRLLYFSYVTLSTVGNGDVVPLRSLASGTAVLEAMTGQLLAQGAHSVAILTDRSGEAAHGRLLSSIGCGACATPRQNSGS